MCNTFVFKLNLKKKQQQEIKQAKKKDSKSINSQQHYVCNTWWMSMAEKLIFWLNVVVTVMLFITSQHKL